MAYINKFLVAVAVLFLAVTITPQLTEAENLKTVQHTDTNCTAENSAVVKNCYTTLLPQASKECCEDLKKASQTEVTCLCDNFMLNTSINNDTRAHYYRISLNCGVFDKFVCGKLVSGGVTNKIAASMSLFSLVTYLLF